MLEFIKRIFLPMKVKKDVELQRLRADLHKEVRAIKSLDSVETIISNIHGSSRRNVGNSR